MFGSMRAGSTEIVIQLHAQAGKPLHEGVKVAFCTSDKEAILDRSLWRKEHACFIGDVSGFVQIPYMRFVQIFMHIFL